MDYYGNPVTTLIEELARLPGIGRKTAQRLAFHIIGSACPCEEGSPVLPPVLYADGFRDLSHLFGPIPRPWVYHGG